MKTACVRFAILTAGLFATSCGPPAIAVRATDGSLSLSNAVNYRLDRGVLVDTSTGTLFITSPEGRLVAVHAPSGQIHWKAENVSTALVSAGGVVLSIGTNGPGTKAGLVVLNVGDGRPLRYCPVPDTTPLLIGDSLGSANDVVGAVIESNVLVRSTWSRFYAGGAAPSPEMLAAAQQQGENILQVDLSNCALQPAPPHLSDKLSHSFANSGGFAAQGSFEAGPFNVTFRHDPGVKSEKVVLLRTQNGSELPPVTLMDDAVGYPSGFVSIDRRYVWMGRLEPTTSPVRYTSRIFDLTTGEQLGSFSSEVSPSPFYLVDGTIVTSATKNISKAESTPTPNAGLTPTLNVGGGRPSARGVVGIALKDGSEVFWHEVLSYSYNGPYPP